MSQSIKRPPRPLRRRSVRRNPDTGQRPPFTPTAVSGGPPRHPSDKPGDAERIAARRVQALQLRIGGATYRQIGSHLGVSAKTAYEDVACELLEARQHTLEKAEEILDLELKRLDDITKTALVQFRAGSPKAGEIVLRAMDRRSKYLGLDKPTKVAPTTPDGEAPYEPLASFEAAMLGATDEERSVLRGILERMATTDDEEKS